ncbi:MAG: pirin family protein [Pseudomonadota bacterium]
MQNPSPVTAIHAGQPASDGAGVRLTRIIGTQNLDMVDPFLMLDRFHSDQPGDYLAGFPDHPHRGFETVTYMVAGRMRHRDNKGHEGVIEAGGVQWMTAGGGIIHSEMPEQSDGVLWGYQLWVNLPASDKMVDPRYAEFSAPQIPEEVRDAGASLKVVTGTTSLGTTGPVTGVATDPLYFDITLAPSSSFVEPLPAGHSAMVVMVTGTASIGSNELGADDLAVLGEGDGLSVTAGSEGARLLLIAGRPLAEPVARYGPFVMNSQAELRQAVEDFQAGRF